VQNLLISPGGLFNANPVTPLNLTVFGDALVQPGGAIVVDGAGYVGYDPVSGPFNASVDFFGDGSGGGYGGTGGASFFGAPGGGTYGSSNQPVNFGSAGGTSPALAGFSQGGGAMHLIVNHTLTVNGPSPPTALMASSTAPAVAPAAASGYPPRLLPATAPSPPTAAWANPAKAAVAAADALRLRWHEFLCGKHLRNRRRWRVSGTKRNDFYSCLLPYFRQRDESKWPRDSERIAGFSSMFPLITDANGAYSVSVSPIWTGSITPAGKSVRSAERPDIFQPCQRPIGSEFPAHLALGPQSEQRPVRRNERELHLVWDQRSEVSAVLFEQPRGLAAVRPGNNRRQCPAGLSWPTTNAPQLFFRLNATY